MLVTGALPDESGALLELAQPKEGRPRHDWPENPLRAPLGKSFGKVGLYAGQAHDPNRTLRQASGKSIELELPEVQMLPFVYHCAQRQQGRVAWVDRNDVMRLEKSIQTLMGVAGYGAQPDRFPAGLEEHETGIACGQPAERLKESRGALILEPQT